MREHTTDPQGACSGGVDLGPGPEEHEREREPRRNTPSDGRARVPRFTELFGLLQSYGYAPAVRGIEEGWEVTVHAERVIARASAASMADLGRDLLAFLRSEGFPLPAEGPAQCRAPSNE